MKSCLAQFLTIIGVIIFIGTIIENPMILWVLLGMLAILFVMAIVFARKSARSDILDSVDVDAECDYNDSDDVVDDEYDRLHPDGQVWDPDLRMWVDEDCDADSDDDDDVDDEYDRLHPDGQVWDPDLRMWVSKGPEAYTFAAPLTSV